VAKTTLSKVFARLLGCQYQRVQFTPDLLPSDVTGTSIFDRNANDFVLRRGPIFTQVLLADEINRAPAKTQAALLEAMQEHQVTVDGQSLPLPLPFLVLATQNPVEQEGVYRLPEAQLDRFLMKTSVGYPDAESTEELLMSSGIRDRAAMLEPVVDPAIVQEMSKIADRVYVDRAVISYVRKLAEVSRELEHVRLGLSARGCLALIRVAKSWAAADGPTHVVPQDVVTLASPVLCHRLILDAEAAFRGVTVDDVVQQLMAAVPAPSDRA
jgi:MoxR-like ATPase